MLLQLPQQTLRCAAVGRLPEPLERQQREVSSLPERIVTVAASRESSDDRVIGIHDASQLHHGRLTLRRPQLTLTFERAFVQRTRGTAATFCGHRRCKCAGDHQNYCTEPETHSYLN